MTDLQGLRFPLLPVYPFAGFQQGREAGRGPGAAEPGGEDRGGIAAGAEPHQDHPRTCRPRGSDPFNLGQTPLIWADPFNLDADIKKAALEAIKGSRCDLLLVCAFAFEASVHEQTAELTKEIKFGKLAVLPVRMNPEVC
jgi:hypothetical protein